jgi:hypothetical protein
MIGPVAGFVAELGHQCLYKRAPTGRNAALFFAMIGALTMAESGRLRWLNFGFRMSTTVELSLLGLTAAAAGSFAFVGGDWAFTVILW